MAEQAMAAVQILPTQPWPQPTFPQFDNDRAYQRQVVDAMRKGLNQHNRMAPVLINKEEDRVLRAELERARESIALARKMIDFPIGRGPSILPVGTVAPVTPHYVKILDVSKLLIPDSRVRIAAGDISGALQDIHAVLHLSRASRTSHRFWGAIGARARHGRTRSSGAKTLAGGTATEPELASLQHELKKLQLLLVSWLTRRASLYGSNFEDAQTGVISWTELRQQVDFTGGKTTGSMSAQVMEAVRFWLFVLASTIRTSTHVATTKCSGLANCPWASAGKPSRNWQCLKQQAIRFRAPGQAPIFSDSILFNKYFDDEVHIEALLWCGVTAAAASDFAWPRVAGRRISKNSNGLPERSA